MLFWIVLIGQTFFYRKSCNPACAQLKINLTLKVTFHLGNACNFCCLLMLLSATYTDHILRNVKERFKFFTKKKKNADI